MTLSIELDEETLRKLAEAAGRDTKTVAEWARERLAEAVNQRLRSEPSAALSHLERHFGTIEDSTFVAPPRSANSREIAFSGDGPPS
jgi:hypothetical protein